MIELLIILSTVLVACVYLTKAPMLDIRYVYYMQNSANKKHEIRKSN